MKAKLCKCNNCDTIMIDQNSKTDTPELEVPDNAVEMQFIYSKDGGYWGCPVCDDDGYLMDITEQSQLPSTPVDEVKDKHTERIPFSKRTHEDIYSEFVNEWGNDIALMADNYNRTVEQMTDFLFPVNKP